MLPDKFLSNPVHEKLEQLKQLLLNNDNREKIPIENLDYFESFYNYCKDRLNLTMPILVQEPELNSLSAEIESGIIQINNYLGNNNIGHINNTINNFNSALNRIRNFPFPLSKDDFDFARSIAAFQKNVQESYDTLNAINKRLETELSTIQTELNAKQLKIQELERKLQEKETEIQNVLIRYNTEFDLLRTTANSTIEEDRRKFAENIESDRKNYGEMFNTESAGFKTTFEEFLNKVNSNSTDLIGKINNKLDEANKIVNVIGNVGVTGNYQNIANQNRIAANFWRWVAIGFMAVMTGLLIWSIIDLSYKDFDLYKSLVRIIAAAVLTYPAIYASRESSKHRQLETKNRNLELELASVGPFIEILPEAKKQQIKEDLVKKYFGNENDYYTSKGEDEDVSIGGFEKIIKALLPILKKS